MKEFTCREDDKTNVLTSWTSLERRILVRWTKDERRPPYIGQTGAHGLQINKANKSKLSNLAN